MLSHQKQYWTFSYITKCNIFASFRKKWTLKDQRLQYPKIKANIQQLQSTVDKGSDRAKNMTFEITRKLNDVEEESDKGWRISSTSTRHSCYFYHGKIVLKTLLYYVPSRLKHFIRTITIEMNVCDKNGMYLDYPMSLKSYLVWNHAGKQRISNILYFYCCYKIHTNISFIPLVASCRLRTNNLMRRSISNINTICLYIIWI